MLRLNSFLVLALIGFLYLSFTVGDKLDVQFNTTYGFDAHTWLNHA